jgi:hypothetical protein
VAPSPLCNSILVEIKCINIRRKTTVFSNCWRNQLHVSAETCSWFLQKFENTVVLRRTFIDLISTKTMDRIQRTEHT